MLLVMPPRFAERRASLSRLGCGLASLVVSLRGERPRFARLGLASLGWGAASYVLEYGHIVTIQKNNILTGMPL